jgi:hypothetical protein
MAAGAEFVSGSAVAPATKTPVAQRPVTRPDIRANRHAAAVNGTRAAGSDAIDFV